jgi:hypothetical protein
MADRLKTSTGISVSGIVETGVKQVPYLACIRRRKSVPYQHGYFRFLQGEKGIATQACAFIVETGMERVHINSIITIISID